MRNKLWRSYGVVKDQLPPNLPEDLIFKEYLKEYNLTKDKKRDLTNREIQLLIDFMLGWVAMEHGIYLLAPNEKPKETLFDET